MFALIDVNGMYAACESAFRPDLASRAVCCLSNNDGAIVARNRLAKLAGLKMGEPYFKARPLIEAHNVAVFSSNYTLYASMSGEHEKPRGSHRMMPSTGVKITTIIS
ncbi:Error-prone [Klebsiella pneumoniae]|nr:Error-prone [Klebsiella pneumoniae]